MKIEAVIFDWAGTTVDFGCFAPVQAFISAFEKFGITPTVEEVRKPMGMLKREHIKTMFNMERIGKKWAEIYGREFNENDIDEVYRYSEENILNVVGKFTDVKPYVLEAVQMLREKNIKIGSTTGYTDDMMKIVLPKAEANGYKPDFWCSPNSVNNIGRPYPYMIFKNLENLKVSSVKNVIKIGDTVSDIKEGKNAGVISVGVVEGSSIMALSKEEYEKLSQEEKEKACKKVEEKFLDCGADYVIKNMGQLKELLEKIEG